MGDTWTPIYSGTTNKLIAGVSGNNVYVFSEVLNGGSWAQIGCSKDNCVYSVSGSDEQLIGEVEVTNGEYRCIINRNESINISKDFCENGINENKKQGFSTDYYENRLIALQKMMPRLLVARILEPRDKTFSCVHIYETGENFVYESRWHDVILYAKAGYQNQNASPYALAVAFLVIQYHPTFNDVDRPLKCLWDF